MLRTGQRVLVFGGVQLTECAEGEDEDEGEDVGRSVVCGPVPFGPALRFRRYVFILPSSQLFLQDVKGDVGPRCS